MGRLQITSTSHSPPLPCPPPQAFGKSGAYMCILEEQRSMNGAAFQKMASSPANQPPKRRHADDTMLERSFWSSITVR